MSRELNDRTRQSSLVSNTAGLLSHCFLFSLQKCCTTGACNDLRSTALWFHNCRSLSYSNSVSASHTNTHLLKGISYPERFLLQAHSPGPPFSKPHSSCISVTMGHFFLLITSSQTRFWAYQELCILIPAVDFIQSYLRKTNTAVVTRSKW